MATHRLHPEKSTFYFITFTCHNWMPLFEKTNAYDYFPFWFKKLEEKGVLTCGYVIMPNHVHLLVYLTEKADLNKSIAESKRFLAYELVKRLSIQKELNILDKLESAVQPAEKLKGKKHQVFRLSFDAKECKSENDINKVLEYIHNNPVSGKWKLVEDFLEYNYSSAAYYESDSDPMDKHKHGQDGFQITDYRTILSESLSGDSEGR